MRMNTYINLLVFVLIMSYKTKYDLWSFPCSVVICKQSV